MVNFRATLVLLFAVLQVVTGFAPDLFGATNDVGAAVEPYRTPLVPAGWAFAIWGLLYLGCFVFAVFHALRRHEPGMARVGWLAALAFLGNAVWVLHQPTYGPGLVSFLGLEVLAMLAISAAFLTLKVDHAGFFQKLSFGGLWALAGWLTIASPAGLSLALVFSFGWDLSPAPTDAVLPIVVCWLPIAWGLTWFARRWFFIAPIVWGLYGVAMANTDETQFFWGILALAASFVGLTLIAKNR